MPVQTSTAVAGTPGSSGRGGQSESGQEPLAYAKLWGKLDDKNYYAYVVALPTTLGRGSAAPKGAGFIDLGGSKALSREHAKIEWESSQGRYRITCIGKNGMVVAGKFRGKGGQDWLTSRTPIKLGPAHLYFLLPEGDLEDDAAASEKTSGGGCGAGGAKAELVSPPAPASGAAQSVAATPTGPTSNSEGGNADEGSVAKKRNEPTRSFDDMVSEAFRSPELAAAAASGGLLATDVLKWVEKSYPDWNKEALKGTLAAGIEGALKSNFTSSAEGRWIRGPTTNDTMAPSAKQLKIGDKAIAGATAAAATATATTTSGASS